MSSLFPIPFQTYSFKIPRPPITSYTMDLLGYTQYFQTACTLFDPIQIPNGVTDETFLARQSSQSFSSKWNEMRKQFNLSDMVCIFNCGHRFCPVENSSLEIGVLSILQKNPEIDQYSLIIARDLCPLCRKVELCPPDLAIPIRSKFPLLYRFYSGKKCPYSRSDYRISYEKKCYEFLYTEPALTFQQFCNEIFSRVAKQAGKKSVTFM